MWVVMDFRSPYAHGFARVAACTGHSAIADPAAKGALEAVADDPDPDVRKNVRWALQQIAAGNAA